MIRQATSLLSASLLASALMVASFITATSVVASDLTVRIKDKDGASISGAVVFLGGGAPTKAGSTVRMLQKNQSFNPDVLAVAIGTTIEFPNEDPFRHHVYSFSPAKRFELKLYGGDEIQKVVFDQAGEIALGCNIHDDMLGYIYVVDSNLFGTTGEDGRVLISGLDDTTVYEAQVWHPRLRGPTRRTAQSASAG